MTNANSIEAITYLFPHLIFILIRGCRKLTDQSQTELAEAIAQNKGLTYLSINYPQIYIYKKVEFLSEL